MKTLTIILSLFVFSLSLSADGLVLIAAGKAASGLDEDYSNLVDVAEGETATIETFTIRGDGSYIAFAGIKCYAGTDLRGLELAGPVQIRAYGNFTDSDSLAFAQIRIQSADTASVEQLPYGAVVIPEDAAGNVQIILESSTDLVNWTAAQPGAYSASTAQRFFRLRAVTQ